MSTHVAIIGGGFTGTMLAVQLLARGGRVTLFERRGKPGLGLAYGAADSSHLLNVRASNMSAFPDQPDHLVRWLEARGVPEAASAFAPRPLFGEYVREIFAEAARAAGDRLQVINGSALELNVSDAGASVTTDSGDRVEADAAVLATGNLPPLPPRGIEPAKLSAGRYFGDPWTKGVADGLSAEDIVLIIGTGLTMIDMALLLDRRGFQGKMLAISRRGLLPRSHAPGGPAARDEQPLPASATGLLREVRRRARDIGWRATVDQLRPVTQDMWRNAALDERARFLRHLRPWWDVHRHRIAPEVYEQIQGLISSGRLAASAGKLISAEEDDDLVRVSWRPRGSADSETVRVARIINCTGPEGDLPRTSEPLLRRLVDDGTIRPGPFGIGAEVDGRMRVIGKDGSPNARLFAAGPLTRGILWEIVAVPDIRAQVRDIAERLSVTG